MAWRTMGLRHILPALWAGCRRRRRCRRTCCRAGLRLATEAQTAGDRNRMDNGSAEQGNPSGYIDEMVAVMEDKEREEAKALAVKVQGGETR